MLITKFTSVPDFYSPMSFDYSSRLRHRVMCPSMILPQKLQSLWDYVDHFPLINGCLLLLLLLT